MNNKGSTLSGWFYAVILMLGFVVLFSLTITEFGESNGNTDVDTSFGVPVLQDTDSIISDLGVKLDNATSDIVGEDLSLIHI